MKFRARLSVPEFPPCVALSAHPDACFPIREGTAGHENGGVPDACRVTGCLSGDDALRRQAARARMTSRLHRARERRGGERSTYCNWGWR